MIPKHPVRIAFLDVGQGDTIVISIPQTQEAVIVDCVDVDAVLRFFNTYIAQTGDFFVENSGCPCAGTVIIELGQNAKILQPSRQFHQKQVILPHYTQHQCVIGKD